MTNPQLQLINITRAYQVGEEKVFALNQVNLKVYPGDYISIMGPSGSGKSTLLNVIGLLDKPDSGDYLLNNKNVTSLTEEEQADVRQQTIGFVFQSFHLVPRLSAQENIELPMVLAGVSPEERHAKVNHILTSLGLEQRAHHKPNQ